MQLRILAEAVSELEAAVARLDEHGLGSAFLDAYELKLRQITRFPKSAPTVKGTAFRSFLIRRFQYSVIVGEFDCELVIVAIAHSRREPNYWKGRSK